MNQNNVIGAVTEVLFTSSITDDYKTHLIALGIGAIKFIIT